MRKVNDVINYALVLADNIKTTGSVDDLEEKILSYIKEDRVPYSGLLNKERKIPENLEIIDPSLNGNITNKFMEYLKKYPIIIGDASPGSHLDISQAPVNNGFVFMLGLVVTILAHDLIHN